MRCSVAVLQLQNSFSPYWEYANIINYIYEYNIELSWRLGKSVLGTATLQRFIRFCDFPEKNNLIYFVICFRFSNFAKEKF